MAPIKSVFLKVQFYALHYKRHTSSSRPVSIPSYYRTKEMQMKTRPGNGVRSSETSCSAHRRRSRAREGSVCPCKMMLGLRTSRGASGAETEETEERRGEVRAAQNEELSADVIAGDCPRARWRIPRLFSRRRWRRRQREWARDPLHFTPSAAK